MTRAEEFTKVRIEYIEILSAEKLTDLRSIAKSMKIKGSVAKIVLVDKIATAWANRDVPAPIIAGRWN